MSTAAKTLTPGRMVLIYLIALLLVSVHEMDRWVNWVENTSLNRTWPTSVLDYCQKWRETLEKIGLTGVHRSENHLLAWARELPEIGRIPEKLPAGVPTLKSSADSTSDPDDSTKPVIRSDASSNWMLSGAIIIGGKGQTRLYPEIVGRMGNALASKSSGNTLKNHEKPGGSKDRDHSADSPNGPGGEGPIPNPSPTGPTGGAILAAPDSINRNSSGGPLAKETDNKLSLMTVSSVLASDHILPNTSLVPTLTMTTPASEQITKPLGPEKPINPTSGTTNPAVTAKRRPKTILIVGDSMIMEGFGVALQRAMKGFTGLNVVREGRYSTGLTRPDYFDWTPYLKELIQKHQPDVLVISLGANDPQDILDENRKRFFVASEGWNALYGTRARDLLKIPAEKGIVTFWVGLPIMGPAVYSTRIQNLNSVVQSACASNPLSFFVDTWLTLADASQKYTSYLRDATGKSIRIRASDNIHVTEAGGEIMVQQFLKVAGKYIDLTNQTAEPSSAGNSPKAPVTDPKAVKP
ncbi:MAG: DUF459 domain-containing protein [Deltaproteobacteria bacterium]|nr:DUF459 domain-containing protein [Deltaproteobacteria bacterium]